MNKIIIGTRSLSGDFRNISKKKIYKILKYLIENNFNHFDTSEVYGYGLSDAVLSEFKFDDILVDIKCGYNTEYIKTFKLEDIYKTVERSLKKFKKINTLYLHNPRKEIKDWAQIMDLLKKLKKQNIINFLGVSIARDPEQYYFTKKILSNFDYIQDEYNLFKQPNFNRIPKKEKIVARSVFASGLFNAKHYVRNDMRSDVYYGLRKKNISRQIFLLKKIFGKNLIKSSFELVYFDKRISNLIVSFSSLEQVDKFLKMHKLKKNINFHIKKKYEKLIKNNFYLRKTEVGY